jgi:hypothetical protein
MKLVLPVTSNSQGQRSLLLQLRKKSSRLKCKLVKDLPVVSGLYLEPTLFMKCPAHGGQRPDFRPWRWLWYGSHHAPDG